HRAKRSRATFGRTPQLRVTQAHGSVGILDRDAVGPGRRAAANHVGDELDADGHDRLRAPHAARHRATNTAVAGIAIAYFAGRQAAATNSVMGRKMLPRFICRDAMPRRRALSDDRVSSCASRMLMIPSPMNAMCPSRASRRDVSPYSPSHAGVVIGPSNDQSPMTRPVATPTARLIQPMVRFMEVG